MHSIIYYHVIPTPKLNEMTPKTHDIYNFIIQYMCDAYLNTVIPKLWSTSNIIVYYQDYVLALKSHVIKTTPNEEYQIISFNKQSYGQGP